MPIYPDRKGSHRVRIWHRGKRQDWIVHGTKAEAKEFEARKRVEFAAHEPMSSRTVPGFEDYCVRVYSPSARAELAPGTWRNREYQVTLLCDAFGQTRLNAFTFEALTGYVDDRRGAGVRDVKIADDLKVLKAILNHARKVARVPVIIPTRWPRLKMPKPNPRERVRIWTTAEVRRLFRCCEATILPIVTFLANTGCRKTEAVQLRCRAVDLRAGVVWIEPVRDEDNEVTWEPKDRETRPVPISARLRPILARLTKGRRPDEAVFRGGRSGEGWSAWPQKRFDEARAAAGLTGGPHALRHTYASHFLHNGGSMATLAKILGHSNERTTELYAHLIPGALKDAAGRVDL